MDISEIDKNFKIARVTEKDVKWLCALDTPFSAHGVFYDYNNKEYRRMPKEIADKVSDGVAYLARNTAGGRLRFKTNSKYVAVKVRAPYTVPAHHMTPILQFGFSLYADGEFKGTFTPIYNEFSSGEPVCYESIRYLGDGEKEIELHFPLYGGVNDLFIGVQECATVKKARAYAHPRPVVFYGSSITQGGCATRPGNDYVGFLCRMLDTEILNLGFSGNAKGEKTMVAYLASLDPSVYVIDYDHNAPNAEHLQATHMPLYEGIRAARPSTPILFMTKPDFESDPDAATRRSVIYQTYTTAKSRGDKNVAFIDGEHLFGKDERGACTVDGCHPTDLGFYRMACTVAPVLKEFLK